MKNSTVITFLKTNLSLINTVLILGFIGYSLLKKRTLLEGFEGNVVDFEALDNLAKIAQKLNSGDDFEFPGSLTLKGELTIGNAILKESHVALLNKMAVGGGGIHLRTSAGHHSASGGDRLHYMHTHGGGNLAMLGHEHGAAKHSKYEFE